VSADEPKVAVSWRWIVAATIVVLIVTSLRFWAIQQRNIVLLNLIKPALAIAQPIAIWLLCAAFARDWQGVRRWRGHGWVSAALIVAYAAVNSLLHPYFDRQELRALGLGSDIDDEFIVAAGNALRLRSPYADALYSGNPISEGPAWVILNAIFGSRAWFPLLAPTYAAIFAAILWRTTRAPGAATMALLLSLASTGLWESSFGGDLAAAGFAMASGTLLCLSAGRRMPLLWIGTVLIGAVATVRLPFVFLPVLAALLLARAGARTAALVVLIGGLSLAVGSHLVFWAAQSGDYPPLHLVGQSLGSIGPFGLAIAGVLAALLAWAVWRLWLGDEADVLLWQGLGLFGPFAIVALGSIAAGGLTGEDWTRYLTPSVPSFAAAAALGAYRRRGVGTGGQEAAG
jgi:hypothetical protein